MARQSRLTNKIVDCILNDYIKNGAVPVGGRLPTVVELTTHLRRVAGHDHPLAGSAGRA